MLDVTFHTKDGEPFQRVHRGRTVDFREHDATKLSDDEVKALVIEHANHPFDLEKGPVVRLEIFRTNDGADITLLSMHHIISDAWSDHRFDERFDRKLLRPSSRQNARVARDRRALQRLPSVGESPPRKVIPGLGCATTGSATSLTRRSCSTCRLTGHVQRFQTFNGGAYGFKLDEDLTAGVLNIASEKNITLFTMMLSAYEVLMHRYCNQDDILVGVPLAGRNQAELHDLVGYFINPVPVRSQVNDDPTFAEYVTRNSETVIGALENQHYPLAKLVDDVKAPRDASRSPVFQISFGMEKVPGLDGGEAAVFMIGQGGHKIHLGDITVESVDVTLRQAQFEITLMVEEAGGQLYGVWQYNADLFDESTIAYLSDLYAQVLSQVSENADLKISEINLLSTKEEKKILTTWNKTKQKYPSSQLLHELVADQVTVSPDKIAVRCGGDSLTFNQLDRKADGLAWRLADAGVGPDQPVALLTERSCDMVAGTLGILKSGACYVPMDPEVPGLPSRADAR